MGDWIFDKIIFEDFIFIKDLLEDVFKFYFFYLVYVLEDSLEDLGLLKDWIVECKWDGICGQFIVRKGEFFVWLRGEELVIDKFLEYYFFVEILFNGIVIDGEILFYKDGQFLIFNDL